MAIKPILFNTEMVRAIQDRQKIVTRRVVKQNKRGKLIKPYEEGDVLWVRETWAFWPCITCGEPCVSNPTACGGEQFGRRPETLETADGLTDGCFLYRADGEAPVFSGGHIWRPAIHMPKAATRIFLRVTKVNCEPLRESFLKKPFPIREMAAEGLTVSKNCVQCWTENFFAPCERQNILCIEQNLMELRFQKLWDSTIPKDKLAEAGWDADPKVWVIRFERVAKPARWPNV